MIVPVRISERDAKWSVQQIHCDYDDADDLSGNGTDSDSESIVEHDNELEEDDDFDQDGEEEEDEEEDLTVSSTPTVVADYEDMQAFDFLGSDLRKEISRDPIRKSLFSQGEDVLVFPPVGEKVSFLPDRLQEALRWKISGFTPKVVRAALLRANFSLVRKGKNWIGYWGKHPCSPCRFKRVQSWQKINHFPMSFQIGRKDKLWGNYVKCRGVWGHEHFNFIPDTYLLPAHLPSLLRTFSIHPLWIIKPPASARGHGIKVINTPKRLPKKKKAVISKYITKPFLIGGRKFDIRLYVLVTSWEPLRVYLASEGIVRFAGQRYTNSPKSASNRFIHLTNYSINKRSKDSSHPRENEEQSYLLGDPRSFSALQEYFSLIGIDFVPVYKEIQRIVVNTIICGHASNASGMRLYTQSRTSCYELFGFDILLDSALKPWLMEVNISPSLKASCDLDWKIKSSVVTDILNLVGVRVCDIEKCAFGMTDKSGSSWERRRSPSASSCSSPSSFPLEKARCKSSILEKDRHVKLGPLSVQDILLLQESEDEYSRRGNFIRLVPPACRAQQLPYLNSTTYATRLLHDWTHLEPVDQKRVDMLRSLTPGATVRVLPNLTKEPHTMKPRASSSLSCLAKPSKTAKVVSSSLSCLRQTSSQPSPSSLAPFGSSHTKFRAGQPAPPRPKSCAPLQESVKIQQVNLETDAQNPSINNTFPSWKVGRTGQYSLKIRKETRDILAEGRLIRRPFV
ncbi:uncharacterized protein SPPG_00019 [Spizellomyces punctatus DAOM BR117]|uniref:Tubulin polyglutamylase TTLL4 n=1 Tax=Spizellomyces punctatus (strain DAOM BR117) TaxID=645134 RepID=A0A0L0HT60_SPIPD|nr:uncharacterized protein SPPG_00019 [Spizellomyces punctatus DAOM BR117]KND04282.1 hypothetical protein SPPG_00019 [Spizellomyces punctatus DAOM BR117]|eukprot:XP_016612321.1 hypothetical protein SPPG_00019 [Spizellomyces punctatus DAOM BR117]